MGSEESVSARDAFSRAGVVGADVLVEVSKLVGV